MIQNKILTLNWCFIVISDVKNITENFAVCRSASQIFFAWITTSSSQQIIECVTFMMLCNQYFFDVFILVEAFNQLDVHDIFNIALSRRSYFSESISMKDCWESVSALVDVYEYNDDTRVDFFFWITSSALLSYTSIFVNARASLIFLSMLDCRFHE